MAESVRAKFAKIRSITNLVVDSLIKVLDEDVSLTRLTESGVTLGPHDTATQLIRNKPNDKI